MSIIDNQQAQELAQDEAIKQNKCQHEFKTRHITLLDQDVEICSKCDINKKLYDLSLSTPCYGQYHWYTKKCWTCPLSLNCKAKKQTNGV